MLRNKKDSTITISLSGYKILIIIALIAFIIYIWKFFISTTILLYISFILASLLRQISTKLYNRLNKKLPFKLVLAIVYLSFIGIFLGLLVNIISQVITQTSLFLTQILHTQVLQSTIINPISKFFPFLNTTVITTWLASSSSQLLSLQTPLQGAKWAINIIPYLIFIFLATWYLLVDLQPFIKQLLKLLPSKETRNLILYILGEVDRQIGTWARAQLLLMLIIGIASFIALAILKVPYSLSLATLSGLLEIIPNFGPMLAAIPAIIAGLITGTFVKASLVALAYFVIQQLENNLLVPYIMGSITGMHPLLTILLIMFGQALMGPVGAILSIPVYMTTSTIITSYNEFNQKNETSNPKTTTNS